jgi:chromate transporter
LQRVLRGVAAAAAGLIVAIVIKMAKPMVRELSPAPFVALAAFAAIGIMRWPLPWVLVVMAPVSIALSWWARR